MAKSDLGFIMEKFCGWTLEVGQLVQACVDSGFLVLLETDGKATLLCKDFFPSNNHCSSSFVSQQAKGGYAKAARKYKREALKEAEKELDLFSTESASGLDSDRARQCVVFLKQLSRAMGKEETEKGLFRDEVLKDIDSFLTAHPKDIDQMAFVKWVMHHRNDPTIAQREDLIIKEAGQHMDSAKRDFI